MHRTAELQWHWRPAGPLVTGYSQNLAQAAGLIGRGARQVVNLQTRDADHELGPSFLASSVKGVFRSAAAWLVERTAQAQGEARFVTCDYADAVPPRSRPALVIPARDGLCPICRVFGGSGCLRGDAGHPAQRQQGRVRFAFRRADDAAHGTVGKSPPYHFAWEQMEHRGRDLVVQQLRFDPDAVLTARVDPADPFARALLWLAGDLAGSGFFRFGRFTTRGYGVVRLAPAASAVHRLDALLAGADPTPASIEEGLSGREVAARTLERDPQAVIDDVVRQWLAT
jgi:CRISPR/Cas system CSM-associated protein Csm3 (group 7 of RAMP superfamily)